MTSRLTTIFTRLGYLVAGLVIFMALLISVGHLLTPFMNDHLPDFEKWSSEVLEVPVKIDHVGISWNIIEPELDFRGVTFLDKKTSKPKFSIQEIRINLEIFKSLLTWRPITEMIEVNGAHLTITQQAENQFHVEELKTFAITDNATHSSANFNDILGWIFTQPNLILDNIDVTYQFPSKENALISIKRLNLKNSSDSHHLSGSATLNQEIPTNIKVALDWQGNVMDFPHISANLYLYLEGISLSQWLKDHPWQKFQITDGLGSAKIWADWSDNQFQVIQSQFQFYDIELYSETTKNNFQIPRLSGHVGWKHEKDQDTFAGEDILLDLPDHLWPTNFFKVVVAKNPDGSPKITSLNLDYLNLVDAQMMADFAGFISDDLQKKLSDIQPQGELQNIKINFPESGLSDPTKIALSLHFKNLSVDAYQKFPSINNASGIFEWNGQHGDLNLASHQIRLEYNSVFANPLSFDELMGQINFEKDAKGNWLLNIKNLEAANADLKTHGAMVMTFPVNGAGTIDLSAAFSMTNAAHVSNYLPLKTFDPKLVKWLRSAFLAGQLEAGRAVVQGRLPDFPFDTAPGTFVISGLVKNLDFQFADDWPMIRNMAGELNFTKSAMSADINSGEILGIPLSLVHATIPYIGKDKPQVVTVQGFSQMDASRGVNFLTHSPLEKSIGENFEGLDLTGPLQLKLDLSIPLADTDKTTVQGDITFADVQLNMPSWHVTMNELRGLMHFTENSLDAKNLQGKLFDQPATLDIATVHVNKITSFVKAEIQSSMDATALGNWLNFSLSQYIEGNFQYQAELDLFSREATQPTVMKLQSNLKGLTVNLPKAYGKKADEESQTTVNLSVNHNTVIARFNYKNLLSAALSFLQNDDKEMAFQSGEFRIGSGNAVLPSQPGFVVTAQFDELSWSDFQPYLKILSKKEKPTKGSTSPISMEQFRSFNIDANVIHLFGQNLTHPVIQISKQNEKWGIKITSPEIAGDITVPADVSAVQGHFDHIILSESNNGEPINPGDLPSLDISANDVKYNTLRLGHVTLLTNHQLNGLQIRELRLNQNSSTINASGTWTGNGSHSTTHLKGNLTTGNLSELLAMWGANASSLIANDATAQFDLTWPDAPFKMTLAGLSGAVSINLGHGRVVNLSQSTQAKLDIGKMLSIFSLQTIPRAIFAPGSTDMVREGYNFDSMKATFKIDSGNAYTNDMRFDGPVAIVDIAGRIGLEDKDFNLRLGITTFVTSALLPAAVSVVATPIAGVAAWAVGQLWNQATSHSKTTSYQYRITGSWDNPIWEKAGSSSDTGAPAR